MSLHFLFDGESTKNILDIELIICHIEDGYSSTAPIFSRELIKTEFTSNRAIKRYIGSKFSDGLNLKFSLVKSNYKSFSINEIDIISNWLYGRNDGFKKLELTYQDNDNVNTDVCKFYYKGAFINMEQQRINGATNALTCTFECDSSCMYGTECKIANGMNQLTINDVKCQLPLYPKIIFITSSTSNEFNSITIKNKTNSSIMTLTKIRDGVEYIIDTKNSILKDAYGLCSFQDVGWNKISDISWMYLDKGENDIEIDVKNGECNIKIEYENEILGGVIDEFSV